MAVECIPESIILTSQTQIDNFQQEHGPGCDYVVGKLQIIASDAENLEGLSGIQGIGGWFAVVGTEGLISLKGLESLTYLGSRLEIANNESLADLSALSNIESIGGYIGISGNDSLTDLDWLPSLDHIDGSLVVAQNNKLLNLSGLSNVRRIRGDLTISKNDSLKSLNGLENLSQIDGLLSINSNKSLTSIGALGNVHSIGGRVSLFNNTSLTNINGFQKLAAVLGNLELVDNVLLSDLSALAGLGRVDGDLRIEGNDSLKDLSGFASLESVGGSIRLVSNESMESLFVQSTLDTVGHDLFVDSNSSLVELTGLSNIDRVYGDLWIVENQNLINIDELIAVTHVHGLLKIYGNEAIRSINGLNSLVSAGSNVGILHNPNLDTCLGVIPLLDSIDDGASGPGPGSAGIPDVADGVDVSGNAAGCGSIQEILESELSTEFVVSKSFSDQNPVEVTVELRCDSTTIVHPARLNASQDSAAIFQVRRYIPAFSPPCSADEVAPVIGYSRDQSSCQQIPLTENARHSCSIVNTQMPVYIDIQKHFTDDSSANVHIDVACEEGTVAVLDSTANGADSAEFRISGFPYSGTNCSATEVMPDGYELESSSCGSLAIGPGQGGSCTFVNRPVEYDGKDPSAITGSWYSPSTSGEGFMIHAVDNDTAVAYFYGYDNVGNRLWLIGQSDGPYQLGEPLIFNVLHVVGGAFTDFDIEQIIRSEWGIFELTLWDCDSALAQMFGWYGEKTLELTRLAPTSGTKCFAEESSLETDAVTGSWFEPETSGQGFSIHKVGVGRGVVYFYGFNDEVEHLWLIGTWETDWEWGDEIVIPMQQASGGTFGQVIPEDIVREDWGTLTMRFDDCFTGWARLDGLDGRQELDLVLLAGSLGLECQSIVR